MRFYLLCFLTLSCALPASASKHRGLWFWGSSSSIYGSVQIIGNTTLENQTLAFFNAKKIKRVYGSYGNRPLSEPSVIADWNIKLQDAGIQSQFLMSENTWIFSTNWPSFLTKVTDRVITFNKAPGRTAAEKFDGLHLDIEPQGLPEWSSLTSTQKRDYLFNLRDTFAAVRTHFATAGEPTFPIYADLPVWFDNLPIDGGSIGWASASERDTWFDDIATSLTGISLMPFDRSSFSSINNGVTWERANISGATVRVGIEPDIGPGNTWTDIADYNDIVEQMESNYGASGAVDIQSYRQWREALNSQPIIAVSAALQPLLLRDEGDITFEGSNTWTYVIQHSINLCEWREIYRTRATTNAPIIHTVPLNAQRGYWKVNKFQPFPFP